MVFKMLQLLKPLEHTVIVLRLLGTFYPKGQANSTLNIKLDTSS